MNNNKATKNTSILVESWGTPWQRMTTQVINEYFMDDENQDMQKAEPQNQTEQTKDNVQNEQTLEQN